MGGKKINRLAYADVDSDDGSVDGEIFPEIIHGLFQPVSGTFM